MNWDTHCARPKNIECKHEGDTLIKNERALNIFESELKNYWE